MVAVGEHGGRSTAKGLLIWSACLAGYCALQTLANVIQVELQDFLLLAMPLIAAVTSVWALRGAPRLAIVWRMAFGGAAAFMFGHIYFQYFAG
jgi:hypothetical protein